MIEESGIDGEIAGVRYPIPQYLGFQAKYLPEYQRLEELWNER